MNSEVSFDIARCNAAPEAFMTVIRDGEQRLKTDRDPRKVAEEVLTAIPKTLFWAEIEGDRIAASKPPQ